MTFLLFCVLSGGALWDLRTGRIPNWWLAVGLAGGIAAGRFGEPPGAVAGGLGCLSEAAAGGLGGLSGAAAQVLEWPAIFILRILFFLVLLFPLFLLRMAGAGDIKLLALTGGYLGIYDGFLAGFCGFLTAAVWSLLYMLRKKILVTRIKYFLSYVEMFLSTGRIVPYYEAERDGRGITVCLAPFIWCGFLIWSAVQRGGIR